MKPHFWMLPVVLLGLLAACSPHGRICERAAQCRGGNDSDISACIAELEHREELASIYDCDGRWDAYIDCIDQHGACDGDRLSGCDSERDGYRGCIESGSVRRVRVELQATQ
jgi:hypothetical protein